jgi:hypothetical protein
MSLIPAVAAAAPAVTVRVEGLNKTLLPATRVHVAGGSITKGGTPAGKCPAASAAGALDAATRHNWNGSWDPKYQALSVSSIFGEAHSLTSKDYWSLWVNDAYAQMGICGVKLKAGEQLLFAAVPDSPMEYPLGLQMPRHAVVGHSFIAKVVRYNAAGKVKPLSGATVTVNGRSGKTGGNGTVRLTPTHAGKFVFNATHPGYIRAAAVTVRVTG